MTIIERAFRVEPAGAVGADTFHRRHWLSLVRLAGALTGDRQAAEDVVQDVMIRMHERWHRFDDEDVALVYVRAAVVNGSRSHLRTLLRRRSLPTVKDEPVQPADQAVLARLDSERVQRAVARLPRRQREVVVLRYLCELSVRETAATLGITESAVKASASRAFTTLATRLEGTR